MSLYREDKKAAYMGLIAGAIALLIVIYGMVQITNRKFASHQSAPGVETGH